MLIYLFVLNTGSDNNNKNDKFWFIYLFLIIYYQNLSPEVWQFIREKKFMGMVMPKKFGGLGFR